MAINAIRRRNFVRPAIATGLILSIPTVMTFLDRGKAAGDGWHWGPGSSVVMGVLLFGAGLTYELLATRIRRTAGRVIVGIAIASVVFGIWVELAVGGASKLIHYLAR